jgi:hypothetical protein
MCAEPPALCCTASITRNNAHSWFASAVLRCPAGWSLLQALLRPRTIMVGDDGSVSFVSKAGFSRIGAQEALRHSFLKPAAQHERSLKRSVSSTSSLSLDEGSMTDDGSGSVTATGGSGGRRTAAASGSASNSRSGSGGNGKAASSGSSSAGRWWGGSAARRAAKEEEEAAAAAAAAAAAEAEKAPPATMFTAAAGLWRGLQVGLWLCTAAAGLWNGLRRCVKRLLDRQCQWLRP